MFVKLALRNVRRQVGNYLIYFVTVTLTVALMFAVHNLLYSRELMGFSTVFQDMNTVLVILSVLISLMVAFVLGYATGFMLRLRKREFGTYLTLGMTRKNIRLIFILETLLLGAGALSLGLLAGLFLYQGLMMVMMNLLDMRFELSSYSIQALILTVVLVVAVFLLSGVASAVYLKKVSIYDLIHGEKKVERGVSHPAGWAVVSVLSLTGVIAGFFIFDRRMYETAYNEASAMGIVYCLLFFAVCLFLFHVGMCRSLVWLLLRSPRFCARGSNLFVLRQLSGQLRSNAVIAGILSFLIAFALIGTNAALAYKSSMDAALDRAVPFDMQVTFELGGMITPFSDREEAEREFDESIREMEAIIGEYCAVEGVHPYRIYWDGSTDVTDHTWWGGDGYEGMKDFYIPISSYNELLAAAGREPLSLRLDQYYIVQNVTFETGEMSGVTLEKNGVAASYGGTSRELPPFLDEYFVTVVPDRMVENMEVIAFKAGFDFKDGPYDAQGLQDRLLHYRDTDHSIGVEGSGFEFGIKELSRQYDNSMAALLVIGALYLSVVFVFLATAVLAIKTLAGLDEDRRRYAVLFRLGCGRREQRRALRRQTAVFFFLPFILPMASAVPIGVLMQRTMTHAGLTALAGSVWWIVGIVAILIFSAYGLYFVATYRIACRNVICRDGVKTP